MNRLLTVAILLISTVSLFAQGQQPNVAKLKADAQKVVSVISGDKAKTQTYCQIAKISKQVDQAAQEKDTKKGEGLVQKINELEKQLGPEYLALVDALFNNNMDLNSEDFEEIVSMFDRFPVGTSSRTRGMLKVRGKSFQHGMRIAFANRGEQGHYTPRRTIAWYVTTAHS
jgi:hypothetical protein